MLRILMSAGNIFISLVLGAIAFGFVFLKFPETMSHILDIASNVKAWLASLGFSNEYKNWVRVLLEERQLVFMSFTIIMRILLAVLFELSFGLFRRRR